MVCWNLVLSGSSPCHADHRVFMYAGVTESITPCGPYGRTFAHCRKSPILGDVSATLLPAIWTIGPVPGFHHGSPGRMVFRLENGRVIPPSGTPSFLVIHGGTLV